MNRPRLRRIQRMRLRWSYSPRTPIGLREGRGRIGSSLKVFGIGTVQAPLASIASMIWLSTDG